jgi:hypothetical protein
VAGVVVPDVLPSTTVGDAASGEPAPAPAPAALALTPASDATAGDDAAEVAAEADVTGVSAETAAAVMAEFKLAEVLRVAEVPRVAEVLEAPERPREFAPSPEPATAEPGSATGIAETIASPAAAGCAEDIAPAELSTPTA